MLNSNGTRALAYIVIIDSITPIEGADNIELAHIGGWNVIVKKEEFKAEDFAVFFEIDSKLPETEWSEFLRPKHFKVRTMKLGKFGVISQGLALPLSILPEGSEISPGTDVTDVLGVTYAVEEDNQRKAKSNPNAKYDSMAARHVKLAKKKWFRWLMKRSWGRKLLFVFFGKKKDNPKSFPDWIKRTDEERVENMKWILDQKTPWIVTEKIDGTSTTFALDLTKKKPEFIVCSRNVRQADMNQTNYHTQGGIDNVYWEMAIKYNIEAALKDIAEKCTVQRVVLQGETYGEALQGNPYKIKERRFAAFNLIFDGMRLNSIHAKEILEKYDIPFVPIIDESYILPDDFEELKLSADGTSTISNVKREGFVYRSFNGTQSFKNVSREFLLKHQ